MPEPVECYSGSRYAEHPTVVYCEGNRFEVKEILAQGRQPTGLWFRVRTDQGAIFDLYYDEATAAWRVAAL